MSEDDTTPEQTDGPERGERIAKVLARAGVASRREVERMIEQGRIRLHGEMLSTPAVLVNGVQGIEVDGTPVGGVQATRVWLFHKPYGCLTTNHDPQGRPTVFSLLPANMPRVISVGRLDQNTEGLLVLTNDGGLSRWMELPATGMLRRYQVRVRGAVDLDGLAALARGVTIEGVRYGAVQARIVNEAGPETTLQIEIREGKNREVRRIVKHLGLSVLQLKRLAFGPFHLGTLQPGQVQEWAPGEVAKLVARANENANEG